MPAKTFVTRGFKTIFGGTPTDAKAHALIDSRVHDFASYGGDGAAGIGTKAAMVGWPLAEAQKVVIWGRANGGPLPTMSRPWSNARWICRPAALKDAPLADSPRSFSQAR